MSKIRWTFVEGEDGRRRPAIAVAIPEGRFIKTEYERCATFLRDLLSSGPMPAITAREAALAAGFSPSTVRQTKERMGIVSQYRGRPGEPGRWWWRLPLGEDGK